jgi:hypothetical protein
MYPLQESDISGTLRNKKKKLFKKILIFLGEISGEMWSFQGSFPSRTTRPAISKNSSSPSILKAMFRQGRPW